jgi:hypothetical protein
MGVLGLGRCVYFVSSYGMAKLGLYYNLKENAQLKMKINFYSKYAREETSHLDKLIAFEDRARLRFGMEQISDDVRKAGVGGRPAAGDFIITSLEDPSVMRCSLTKSLISGRSGLQSRRWAGA